MIDLKKYGLNNIDEIHLYDFTPGHGGDFFITLASKCSRIHFNHWLSMEDCRERMDIFKNQSDIATMPGNALGTKLIYEFNYRDKIIKELNYHAKKGKYSYAKKLCFVTHPSSKMVKPATKLLKELFPLIPIKRIALSIDTEESLHYILYHYYNKDTSGWRKQYVLSSQSKDSRFIYWENPENTIKIDHIDLLLNNPQGLKEQVEKLGIDINWKMYDFVLNTYKEKKVDPFRSWFKTI